MLFDVAALLITSVALGPAAGASVAPESVSNVRLVDHETTTPPITINGIGLFVNPSILGPRLPQTEAESVADLGSLSGISLLRELTALSTPELESVLHGDPAVVNRLLDAPPGAAEVTALWRSLGKKQRQEFATSSPRLVGSLDGIPANVRNRANRRWVSASIATLKLTLPAEDGRALAASDQHKLHMLQMVQAALKPAVAPASTRDAPRPTRSLLSVDPSGPGKAVIVLGDLQTADYVTYLVPGMFYTVDGQVGAWTGDAADLYAQQVSWLHRLAATHPEDANKTVAVVAWMGYHTPDLTNIGSLHLAYQARDALTSSVEGLESLRAADEPYTTIVAHSYGSTAALMALTNYGISVDALAVVGSPGSAAQSVTDLDVAHGNVWVGAAAWDPVPNTAFFGSDPGSSTYGAKTMGVGGGADAITGTALSQSIGHNEYFDSGTESMRNMALIGIDEGTLVMKK